MVQKDQENQKDQEKVYINYMGREIVCDAVIASYIKTKNTETIRKENGTIILDLPLEDQEETEGIFFGFLDKEHLLDISTSFITQIWPLLEDPSKARFVEHLMRLGKLDAMRMEKEERRKMENNNDSFFEITTKGVGISSGSSSVLVDVLVGATATKTEKVKGKSAYETRVVLRGSMDEDDFNELLPDLAIMLYKRVWDILDAKGKIEFINELAKLNNDYKPKGKDKEK